MSIFISHSSKDAEIANQICEFLEGKGKQCFLAPRDIHPGKEYAEEIVNGIDSSSAMVLIMSEHSNHSPHVLREVERAVSKSVPILAYKIEDVELSKSLEYFLMTHQWSEAKQKLDFSEIWEFVCEKEKNAGEPEHNVEARKEESRSDAEKKLAGEKKSDKSKKWILAAVTAVVLAIIGIVVGSLMRSDKDKAFVSPYEVGDTITFGTYNDEAIEWRVLRLSEDGTQAVLVSKDILTMKAFDAPESGRYNWDGDVDYWLDGEAVAADPELQVRVRGNNDWSVSNIRTWLNAENEVVTYVDQAPMATAMAEQKNGYQNESGFLYGFTDEELSAIVVTENVTKGNALADGTVTTQDRVYLLSLDELDWFEEAGISVLAEPTQAAIDQDGSNWYIVDCEAYGIEKYYWWLREPVEGTAGSCYLVDCGYTENLVTEGSVGLEGYGIRPAMTVDLTAECFATE